MLGTYVENGEEDEKCVDDERADVRERGEREGHLSFSLDWLPFQLRVAEEGEPGGVGVRRIAVALMVRRLSFRYIVTAVVVLGLPLHKNVVDEHKFQK